MGTSKIKIKIKIIKDFQNEQKSLVEVGIGEEVEVDTRK